jgi:hypothetical protein
METRKEKTKGFKNIFLYLEDKDDRIALLWTLVNSKKINKRQFKELLDCL